MIRIYFLLFLIICLSDSCKPSGKNSDESGASETATSSDVPTVSLGAYKWEQLAENPGYSKTYSYQMFAKDDKVYAFHPDGVWESSDGKIWSNTGLENIVKNQAFLDYIEFNNAIYAIGTFSGNIFNHTLTSQVARTTDFKKWEILAKESNIPRRFFYHPFVFQDKLWLIGGNDGETVYNDAWTSTDGIKWQKVADGLPFGERQSQYFVVFKNQIYMLSHDIWVSRDGLEWVNLTPSISLEDFIGSTPVVFDDKIWLIGNNRNGELGSEVRYTDNGVDWKRQQAPWSPRGSVATCVFKDQLLITGGRYGGTEPIRSDLEYANDVWAMSKR